MKKQTVIEAIRSAQSEWTEWDWTMDFARPEAVVYYSGRPAEDDNSEAAAEAREYADRVEGDAQAASDLAEQAIDSIERGDLDSAVLLMERASSLESAYGDAPAYGRPLKMVRALRDLEAAA